MELQQSAEIQNTNPAEEENSPIKRAKFIRYIKSIYFIGTLSVILAGTLLYWALSPRTIMLNDVQVRNGMIYEINSEKPYSGWVEGYIKKYSNSLREFYARYRVKNGVYDGQYILYHLPGNVFSGEYYNPSKIYKEEIFEMGTSVKTTLFYENGQKMGEINDNEITGWWSTKGEDVLFLNRNVNGLWRYDNFMMGFIQDELMIPGYGFELSYIDSRTVEIKYGVAVSRIVFDLLDTDHIVFHEVPQGDDPSVRFLKEWVDGKMWYRERNYDEKVLMK